MKKKLTDNWVLKVGSLVFAFCLWLIVMNIENPTTSQTFSNIPVQFVNTDVLTDQGLIYEVLENTGTVKSITVYGPRSTVDQLKDEDIVATADFKNMTTANTIPIEFSTNRFNNEITKIRGNISTVRLNIEKEKTIRLVLRVNAVGEVADGYLLGNMVPDQNQIVVSGGETVIDTIDRAVAEVDVTDATAGIATYADVKLLDADGNVIESGSITQNVTSVRVGVEVLATKTVPIFYSVMGTPASGYEATGEIYSDPETVLIAGTASVLEGVSRIEVPAEELNITGQSEDMLATVNVEEFLPDNVILADSSFNGKASVTVYIEKTVSKIFRIKMEQIRVTNVPEGYTATLEDLDAEFELTLTGLSAEIGAIRAEDIIGYVDMQDVMEQEELDAWKEGTYRANLKFDLAEDIKVQQSISAKVVLEKVEE